MSLVRYTNKKTGAVSIYESTSHYDPATKQSRPIRKYLGTEDPETGELIPTSGKRGRKKKTGTNAQPSKEKSIKPDHKLEIEKLESRCREKDQRIKELERENKRLRSCITKLREMAGLALENGGSRK